MRRLCFVLAASLVSAPLRADGQQPYGCWPIKDAVERLACFDMALGAPTDDPHPTEEQPSEADRGHSLVVPPKRPEDIRQ